ncbi:MAG: hypothetical protein AAB263_03845, partial [Planctomycetota bacterium]
LTLHFTDSNTTKQRRRAFQYHYVSERTTAKDAIHQAYPLDSAEPPLAKFRTKELWDAYCATFKKRAQAG